MSISKALREYISEKGLTIARLANDLGLPRRTLENWMYGKAVPKKRQYRQILKQKFPGIFADEQPADFIKKKKPKPEIDSTEVFANISLARAYIAALGRIFLWFLFEASARERDRFREKLGGDWNYFFDLCRAMLGEKAFEVVKKEIGLKGGDRWTNRQT